MEPAINEETSNRAVATREKLFIGKTSRKYDKCLN
jgi:hypothetical protein